MHYKLNKFNFLLWLISLMSKFKTLELLNLNITTKRGETRTIYPSVH